MSFQNGYFTESKSDELDNQDDEEEEEHEKEEEEKVEHELLDS